MLLAMTWPDLETMLQSISDNLPALNYFIKAFALTAGLFFIVSGVHKLKEYGEMRTMMSNQTNLMRPLIVLAVGVILIWSHTTLTIALNTLFASPDPSPLAYASDYSSWAGIITICEAMIQLFGCIAFVRGWLIMASLGSQSHQQGTFGKGTAHVIGGILAINIEGTVHVIQSSIGIT